MSDPVLATATVAVPDPLDVRPLAQPALAAIPADNDNKIVAVDPPATPASREWRSTRAGSIACRLAPALIILGSVLAVAWTAALAWAAFRVFLW